MPEVTGQPIRTAVVGFGISGKVFHAPLIEADPGYSLDVIVTSDPERVAEAARLYPDTRIVPTPEALFALSGDLDLVILGTPPLTHFDLAATAMAHGLNVVVDKPFVTTSAQGEELISRAGDTGVQLTVFQNRRWDADFLTLQKLVRDGALGNIRTFESRFEWWRPEGFGNWRDTATLTDGGGILNDLGTHLIDQAIQLFGPVQDSYGETANHSPHPEGADTEAFVSLLHESGVRSRLWMNGMAAQVGPRFHVLGSEAGYTKWGLDSPGTGPRVRNDPHWILPTASTPRALGGSSELTGARPPSPRSRVTTRGSIGSSPKPSTDGRPYRFSPPSPSKS